MYHIHGNSCSKGQNLVLYDSWQCWGSKRRFVPEPSVLCLPENKQKSLNSPRFPLIIKFKETKRYPKGRTPFLVCFKGIDSKRSK